MAKEQHDPNPVISALVSEITRHCAKRLEEGLGADHEVAVAIVLYAAKDGDDGAEVRVSGGTTMEFDSPAHHWEFFMSLHNYALKFVGTMKDGGHPPSAPTARTH